jgi:hypothetical protein
MYVDVDVEMMYKLKRSYCDIATVDAAPHSFVSPRFRRTVAVDFAEQALVLAVVQHPQFVVVDPADSATPS